MAKTTTKPKKSKTYTTPEALLAFHWRRKADIAYSDFDAIRGIDKPDGVYSREPAYDVTTRLVGEPGPTAREELISRMQTILAHMIAQGYPLSFSEYHSAIAFGYLLADGISYKDFFTKHWHESADHRAYKPLTGCLACKEKKKGKVEVTGPAVPSAIVSSLVDASPS